MAKLRIGDGISLEAKLPEDNSVEKEDSVNSSNSRIDIISDRMYSLDECLKQYIQDLSILEEKVDSNQDDILSVMDAVNSIDMQSTQALVNPEIKQVTFYKDHTKDFEDAYQKMFLDKKELDSRINKRVLKSELKEKLNKQTKINLSLGIVLVISLMLHLL